MVAANVLGCSACCPPRRGCPLHISAGVANAVHMKNIHEAMCRVALVGVIASVRQASESSKLPDSQVPRYPLDTVRQEARSRRSRSWQQGDVRRARGWRRERANRFHRGTTQMIEESWRRTVERPMRRGGRCRGKVDTFGVLKRACRLTYGGSRV